MKTKFNEALYNGDLKVDELPHGGVWLEPGSSFMRKTGDWKVNKPVVDEANCINCGQCWAYCPDSCIKMEKSDNPTGMKMAGIDLDHCKGCGICASICPKQAISMQKAR